MWEIAALEEASGLTFFPSYLTEGRRQALDAAALAWQAVGQVQARKSLPGGAAPLLLMPPDLASSAAPARQQPVAVVKDLVPATDRRLGAGAVHVCERIECSLPRERFWEASSGGGGNGNRELRRQKSVPL